jgi:hypothetical protein
MAITVITHNTANPGFSKIGSSADASGVETVVAAVAGSSHYITGLSIHCQTAIAITIQDNTAVTPVVIVPAVTFAATSAPYQINFINPVKVAAGKSIDVLAGGAGQVDVLVQGYTR